jgi:hypothetical protein
MSIAVSEPIVEMNQDGLLVYSSPESYVKIDNTGLTMKSEEVDFKDVTLDTLTVRDDTALLRLSGSIESDGTQNYFDGITFRNLLLNETAIDKDALLASGSLSADSGSLRFKQTIRGGATGSGGTKIEARSDLSSAITGNPQLEISNTANRGFNLGSVLVNHGFTKVGINTNSEQFHQDPSTGVSSSYSTGLAGPQAVLHVYKPEHHLTSILPIMQLESSGSNDGDAYMNFVKGDYGNTPRHYQWYAGLEGDGYHFHIGSGSTFDGATNSVTNNVMTFLFEEDVNTGTTAETHGRVGINDATPSYPLQVGGSNASSISIYAEEDIAAYSDIRRKTNINTISDSLGIINNIRGVTFYNKDKDGNPKGKRRMGVVAQELEPYLPEIISTDEEGFKSAKYGNLTALLIQAVKEQQEQIEELKEEIKEIKDA